MDHGYTVWWRAELAGCLTGGGRREWTTSCTVRSMLQRTFHEEVRRSYRAHYSKDYKTASIICWTTTLTSPLSWNCVVVRQPSCDVVLTAWLLAWRMPHVLLPYYITTCSYYTNVLTNSLMPMCAMSWDVLSVKSTPTGTVSNDYIAASDPSNRCTGGGKAVSIIAGICYTVKWLSCAMSLAGTNDHRRCLICNEYVGLSCITRNGRRVQ